jgi:hypothetical protein
MFLLPHCSHLLTRTIERVSLVISRSASSDVFQPEGPLSVQTGYRHKGVNDTFGELSF